MNPSLSPRWACVVPVVALLVGCGHVGFVNNERPGLSGTHHVATVSSPPTEDGDDENGDEPSHPLVDTPSERVMAHVHSGPNACAGVVVGPRAVATSRRCLRQGQGAHTLEKGEVRVELPSSSLTWTQRAGSHVLVPACERRDLDVAIVVLSEAASWIEPLPLASTPGPGGSVEAVGFDKCNGDAKEVKRAHVVDRESSDVVLDRALCRGDVGGPVVDDGGKTLVGIQSRRRGPRTSPRKETIVTRFDTTPVRQLLEQAKAVSEGADVAKLTPVTCSAK